jgi:hypothetical protein
MSLVPVDTSSALAVTDYLTKARDWLATAVETSTPHGIANTKAELSVAAEATKQIGLSKEIQADALEMVRRAEYALGKSIRKGQAEGTIASREDNLTQSPFRQRGTTGTPPSSLSKPLPADFFTTKEERGDAYAMAGVSDFDAVLDEAKAEGNLSRANVARIAREKSGKPTAATDPTERAHQEAELINAFAAIVRRSLTPKNISTLSPKARTKLVELFENAITSLKGSDQ